MNPTTHSTLADPKQIIADLQRANAELQRKLNEHTAERDEGLEQQLATADVLKVISRSTFDLGAVLQTVVSRARHLCRADYAVIFRNEGGEYRWAAGDGISAEYEDRERIPDRRDIGQGGFVMVGFVVRA